MIPPDAHLLQLDTIDLYVFLQALFKFQLSKALKHSERPIILCPSCNSVPKVAVESVPILVWCNTNVAPALRRADWLLGFSTPLRFKPINSAPVYLPVLFLGPGRARAHDSHPSLQLKVARGGMPVKATHPRLHSLRQVD